MYLRTGGRKTNIQTVCHLAKMGSSPSIDVHFIPQAAQNFECTCAFTRGIRDLFDVPSIEKQSARIYKPHW
jgi:hypothetical protein